MPNIFQLMRRKRHALEGASIAHKGWRMSKTIADLKMGGNPLSLSSKLCRFHGESLYMLNCSIPTPRDNGIDDTFFKKDV